MLEGSRTSCTDGIVNPLLMCVGGADVPGLGFFLREGDEAPQR